MHLASQVVRPSWPGATRRIQRGIWLARVTPPCRLSGAVLKLAPAGYPALGFCRVVTGAGDAPRICLAAMAPDSSAPSM
jgi:hypothetical protein